MNSVEQTSPTTWRIYNFARRLKPLNGLTPYEFLYKVWTSQPDQFILATIHKMPGLST